MLHEIGTVWVVSFHKEADTEPDAYAVDFHAAVELASEHVDLDGSTFYSMSPRYLIEDDDENRVTIREDDLYES